MELTVLKQGGVFFLTVDDIILNLIGFFFYQQPYVVWKFLDQYQYPGNCPPTPPLTQQQSIDNKLRLMLG